jgi:hypothetical protein
MYYKKIMDIRGSLIVRWIFIAPDSLTLLIEVFEWKQNMRGNFFLKLNE